jgi:Kef-type K+ transport system membrane component KefB
MTIRNETVRPRTKTILRWMAVLPAAIGAYIGVALLTLIFHYLNGDFEFFGQLASAVLSPIAFVYAGARTAPTHHFTTAITLTVLHAVILAAMFGFIAYSLFILKMTFKNPVWWDTTRAAIGVAVTIAACVAIAREERDSESIR